ncbi:hypothetical protein C2845_PM02G24740 [Panicum miliaceum]|uniref:Myb-related protein 306-like n=1 Tax=Panicum miliaceum TaxID=4540 RepID=A0A3L6S487_PANMI|nr:hypothetical protein C2845_PM02G24740 [Panicum miliaceum]
MGRPPCCDKEGGKKGPWTPEEDLVLVSYVQEHGPGNWRAVPANTRLMRCSKSCRLRWTNYLRPGIRRGGFSDQEDRLIVHLQALLGNSWAAIASYLPDRTDNDVKNYWNTHLKKKLLVQQHQHQQRAPSTPSPPPNKGQWELRLQTDIDLARRALRDALSVPPAGKMMISGTRGATAPAPPPLPAESPPPALVQAYALTARDVSCMLDGAPNRRAAQVAAQLFVREEKAAAGGEEVPLSEIESWLLEDGGGEQKPAHDGLLLDAALYNFGF